MREALLSDRVEILSDREALLSDRVKILSDKSEYSRLSIII